MVRIRTIERRIQTIEAKILRDIEELRQLKSIRNSWYTNMMTGRNTHEQT